MLRRYLQLLIQMADVAHARVLTTIHMGSEQACTMPIADTLA
jgi:hypothetical protein